MFLKLQLENFYFWLAWKLPKRLIYWAFIRAVSSVSTGKYSKNNPTTLTIPQILKELGE